MVKQMSNHIIINLLAFFLLIFALLITYFIYLYKERMKNRNELFVDNISFSSNYLYAAYKFFSEWFLTKRYLKKIQRKYEIINPKDKRFIAERSIKTALTVWSLSAIILIGMKLIGFSFYMILISTSLIYIVNSYIIFRNVEIEETLLIKAVENYLGTLRHYYYQKNSVEDAIYESLNDLKQPILYHIEAIYEVLQSDDIEQAMIQYNASVPNLYLKALLSYCITITKYDDRTVGGQSLFLSNLTNLKEDIYVELQKRKKRSHKFAGLVFLAVAPMYTLKLVEKWAIGNFSDLKIYYSGAYGITLTIVIFAISLLIYNIINIMKESRQIEYKDHLFLDKIISLKGLSKFLTSHINENYGKYNRLERTLHRSGEQLSVKQYLMKKVIYSMVTFIVGIVVVFTIHNNNKYNSIHYTGNLINLSSSASDKEVKVIKKSVVSITNKYKNDSQMNEEKILNLLIENGMLRSRQLMVITANEIVERINNYQYEYVKWYEIVIVGICSVIAYQLPSWLLKLREKSMQHHMEDEVIQFQSVILLLMHIERITTYDILTWMNFFSVIFKPSIEACINNFPSGDIESLEELKRAEEYDKFIYLVDNLISADKIGIKKAFDEVKAERKGSQDNRKLENDIQIDNNSAIAEKVSFVPMATIIIFYLIVPFVVESMTQLISYLEQMQTY